MEGEMLPNQRRRLTRPTQFESLPVLPSDTVVDILSRLPVESILRFRRLSKEWCSLLDSEAFMEKHLARASQNPLLLSESDDHLHLFEHGNGGSRSPMASLRAKEDFLETQLCTDFVSQFKCFRDGLVCFISGNWGDDRPSSSRALVFDQYLLNHPRPHLRGVQGASDL